MVRHEPNKWIGFFSGDRGDVRKLVRPQKDDIKITTETKWYQVPQAKSNGTN